MIKRKITLAIFVLLLLLSVFTIFLAIKELRGSTVCLTGNDADSLNCSTVQNSAYGKILGIKVSYLGAFAISALFIIYVLANSKIKYAQNFYEIYLLGAAIGALGAVYFLSIQFFVLKAICSSCVAVDATTIIIAILSYAEYKKRRTVGLSV